MKNPYAFRPNTTLEKKKLTPSMKKATGDAGTYTLPGGSRKFDRLMFWSVEEILPMLNPACPNSRTPFPAKQCPSKFRLRQKAKPAFKTSI